MEPKSFPPVNPVIHTTPMSESMKSATRHIPPGVTFTTVPAEPLPPLTHAELVDSFPCIAGTRTGFDGDRLTGINDFGMASEARTPCARACCVVVLSLINGCGCSLGFCLEAMDAENKDALAALVAAVVERGIAKE